jgi:hypothetical protein
MISASRRYLNVERFGGLEMITSFTWSVPALVVFCASSSSTHQLAAPARDRA